MTPCSACGAPLPADARFCPACGAAVEAPVAPSAEERKLATVLFADLVGSTALADSQDPERVRVTLDRFYDAMVEEIERTGGTAEHFAGDSVMAAFGAPTAVEDHAERALHAALAMQRRLTDTFGEELALRIGVNTGEVVVGRAREGSSFVTGDSVNVAARLEQAAAPGEILAGERTVAAARGAFDFGDPRVVDAKGKPEAVACRAVVRALSLMRPRGVGGLHRVFVGRESELELLRATFRRTAAQGEPHLVTIVGEPGVGKTRLVRELWEVLAEEEPPPLRRTGRCLPYGDGITYWPVGEVVKEHLGILDSDGPEEVKRRLAGREILGLALGLDVARNMHPLDAREELHASVVGFVAELAAERPAVNLVEDIHWAEDDLLDLLERVVRDVRAPVALLATARPELLDRRPTWGAGRRNATTIWLEPLPPEVISQMLDELLAIELPAEIRQLVVETAEGNPFFIEELVGELVDAGVLERHDGTWRSRGLPEGFSVPDSVHAVLAARIDRLPPTEKAALQAASVVGRLFWPAQVVHLLDGVQPSFDLLEERDFIRSRPGSSMAGEREYAIKHALTREVAYASIPKARRGRLHAALAEWLERTDLGKDEHAPLLAYHYAEAIRPEDADLVWSGAATELERLRERAVHWLRRAGELARGRYEMEEAIALLTRAADLSDDEHESALIWRDIGLAQALRYDGEAFWDAMERALAGPLEPEERAEAYGLLAFQTSIRAGMWKVRPRLGQIEAWVERALELAPKESTTRGRALLARANADPEHVDERVLIEGSNLAERFGDAALRSYAFGARSHTAFERRRFEEASAWSERRLELLPEIDDPDTICEGLESAVPVASMLGRFREARRLAGLHWQTAQRLSAHHRVHSVSLRLELDDALGAWRELADETDLVADLVAANLATPCVRNARDLLLCSLAHVCLGDETRARELEREARPLEGAGHERELSSPRLRTALVRGDSVTVRRLAEVPLQRTFVWGPSVFGTYFDALMALREHERIEREVAPFARPGTMLEPFALRAVGAARGDDELLARADGRFRELGLDWHAAQTPRLLAGL
jgi:class 3 adenylate cyclase/tetratricopeptide (TPR) repeat protein